jgi:glycosyltransferase involved in cell wall biosynthesis
MNKTSQQNQLDELNQLEKPFVSIVVPAFNEATIITHNLAILCEYMESLENEYRWELIVVNDGSTDQTGHLAEAFAKKRNNVHVLHHMYNFRLGQALRYAFNNCQGDYIVTMDLDLSYSPDHIGKMLSKIRETRAKIVIASPYKKGGKVSNVPLLRKTLSVWANRFLAFFAKDRFSERLSTLTGMVRAYDNDFLSRLNLKAMDMDINPEIIYKAMILRARIVEIPAHLKWSSEKVEKTAVKKRKSGIRILRNILSSLLSGFVFRPFMFFIIPGLVLLIISFYPFAWIVIHTFNYYRSLPLADLSFDHKFSAAIAAAFNQSPHAFIVGGVTLMVAIQLLSLGFLALQNKRYFEELFHLGSTIYKTNRQSQTM